MRNKDGTFKKGHRYSPETEFKPGQHWRDKKPYWNQEWLYDEYIVKGRSAQDIAENFECKRNNILHFLHKHDIPVRTISQARQVKYWGLKGEQNGIYGCVGSDNPHWKGGITPDRQALYSSDEWASAVKAVWERDKALCQRCDKKATGSGAFHIHHIVSFEIEEMRTQVNNLILLCRKCHHWVHSRANVDREFIDDHNI